MISGHEMLCLNYCTEHCIRIDQRGNKSRNEIKSYPDLNLSTNISKPLNSVSFKTNLLL